MKSARTHGTADSLTPGLNRIYLALSDGTRSESYTLIPSNHVIDAERALFAIADTFEALKLPDFANENIERRLNRVYRVITMLQVVR